MTAPGAAAALREERALPVLTPLRKGIYGLGDLSLNTSLSALSLYYASEFLIQIGGLRPALAGLVLMVGLVVDAVCDPLMGRISDRTRWRAGRRRPYFLIGAIPYGLFFALLWADVPWPGQAARFAYYAATHCLLSISMTVLTVPYLALQPEMVLDYDARTSLNTYRALGSMFGIVAAVALRPLAAALGGGSEGFASAGVIAGVALALPWFAVHRVTFERSDFQARAAETGLLEEMAFLARHETFRRLTGVFVMGRFAMDIASALIVLWVTFWLGRSSDYTPLMLVFLASVGLALPFWLRIARGRDKSRIFIAGALWWMVSSLLFGLIQPDWPRPLVFLLVPLIGVGFAAVDLMPWSMLGEVIDEDDLATGERREGLYNGVFSFVRKIGRALVVPLALGILDLAGFQRGAEQTETTRQAIRWLAALGPLFFLAWAAWLARGYPLTREAHRRILSQIAARQAGHR